MKKNLLAILWSLSLASVTTVVYADFDSTNTATTKPAVVNSANNPTGIHTADWCANHPVECKDKWCANHPKECEDRWCKNHPRECAGR